MDTLKPNNSKDLQPMPPASITITAAQGIMRRLYSSTLSPSPEKAPGKGPKPKGGE